MLYMNNRVKNIDSNIKGRYECQTCTLRMSDKPFSDINTDTVLERRKSLSEIAYTSSHS